MGFIIMDEIKDKKKVKTHETELAVNQIAFEEGQRQLDELAPELKKKEKRKNIIFNWGILGVVSLFLGFLVWKFFL